MANESNNQTTKAVAAAEGILSELKKRAEDAHKANDVFTMSLMGELIKVATPVVTKAVARYHREERARINELHRKMREQARDTKPQKSEP